MIVRFKPLTEEEEQEWRRLPSGIEVFAESTSAGVEHIVGRFGATLDAARAAHVAALEKARAEGMQESLRQLKPILDQHVIRSWKDEPFKGMSLDLGDDISARRARTSSDDESWSCLSLRTANWYSFEIVKDDDKWRLYSEEVVGPGSDSEEGRAAVLAVGRSLVAARNASP